MKTNIVVVALVIAVLFPTFSFAKSRGGHCVYGSQGMEFADALVWTIANPSECGMSFVTYSDRVRQLAEDLAPQDFQGKLVQKFVKKHVNELVDQLENAKPRYFEAIDHEGYFENIVFYESLGFKSGFDREVLSKKLQNKYKERVIDVMLEMKNPAVDSFTAKNAQYYADHVSMLIRELQAIMKKSGLTLQDFGTSEAELSKLAEPPMMLRIKWAMK